MQKTATALALLCSSIFASQAVADLAGSPLPIDHVSAGDVTSLVVIFFIVRWMTGHLDAKDKAFSELIAKNLILLEQKDQRYEAMARECRESSEKLMQQMLVHERKHEG